MYNDRLREYVIENIDEDTFNILLNGVHQCPHQMTRSFIALISFYIQYHQFPAAQSAVESGILELIDDYIEVNVQIAIPCLNSIFKTYIRQGLAKEIVDIIENTEIMQDLNDYTSENEKNEEVVANFLDDYDKLCNVLEQN